VPWLVAGGALALVLVAGTAAGAWAQARPRDPRIEALARSPKLGREIVQQLDRAPTVRALVYFETGNARRTAAHRAGVRRLADALESSGRAGGGLRVLRRYRELGALAIEGDPGSFERLAAHPAVRRIDLDLAGGGQLVQARPLGAIDALRAAIPVDGAGVKVAVLDSGLALTHPDLGGAAIDQACFCSGGGGCCPGGGSERTGAGAAADDHGHGTNVTGIVTGDGGIAPLGAAPDAMIVAVKVLDHLNRFCCLSDILAGLDWVLDQHPDVAAVNMSLGTDQSYAGNCDAASATTLAMADLVAQLRSEGAIVVASTGNQRNANGMQIPACIQDVLSVGAVWDSTLGSQTVFGCTDPAPVADQPTCFSNSSATTDLFAPGAPSTATGLSGTTSTFRGTSQAAALTSGCAALLRQAVPSAAPAALEAALRTSGTWVTVAASGRSYPRLDCLAAFAALAPDVPLFPGRAFEACALGLALLVAAVALRGPRPGAGRRLH
jgi:subtilisin family serine protease